MFEKDKPISQALAIIGVMEMVAGIICSFIFNTIDGTFSFWLLFIWFSSGIVSGFFFLGLSEIIELLHLRRIEENLNQRPNNLTL